MTRSMYPITPQKLGPGIVIGSERIITSKSEQDPASMASGLHSSKAATSNGITVADRRELLLGV